MRKATAVLPFAALALVACVSEPPLEPTSGTPPNADAYELDMKTLAAGPAPLLGAKDLSVVDGTLRVAASAAQGFAPVPFTLENKGAGFDSTVVVTAEVPNGAQLVVGRGRLRDPGTQAGLGVVFAPAEDPTNPVAFGVGLALGAFPDPADGKVKDLGCGGAAGQSYIAKSVAGTTVAAATLSVQGFVFDMQGAPQLVSLGSETKSGAVHFGAQSALATTSTTYEVTYKKTGDGAGTVEARQGATQLFGGPLAVSKATAAGTSFACKLSYVQCVAYCTLQGGLLGVELFGGPCTAESCSNGTVGAGDPEAIDYNRGEACRQTAKALDPCSKPVDANAPTAVAYRVAVNETFKDAAATNQFLLQLVRSPSGESPVVTKIRVTR